MSDIAKKKFWIVGVNLIVMFIYNVTSRFWSGNDGFMISAILIALHVIFCVMLCIVSVFIPNYKHTAAIWLLSALAVMLIGFSTCMAVFTNKI